MTEKLLPTNARCRQNESELESVWPLVSKLIGFSNSPRWNLFHSIARGTQLVIWFFLKKRTSPGFFKLLLEVYFCLFCSCFLLWDLWSRNNPRKLTCQISKQIQGWFSDDQSYIMSRIHVGHSEPYATVPLSWFKRLWMYVMLVQGLLPLPGRLCFNVCLYVWSLARLSKNYWTDYHETWWKDVIWVWEEPIQFWWRSRSESGSRNLFYFL